MPNIDDYAKGILKDEPLFYETIKSQMFTPLETRRPKWSMRQAEAQRDQHKKVKEGGRNGKQR